MRDRDPFAENVRTTDPLTPSEQQKRFHLPPGFEIQLVAAEPDIHKPMNMAFDALGRLWVTTSIEYPWAAPTNRVGRDRLMIFEDFDPNGRARKVTQFADELNIPIGIYPFRSPGRDPVSHLPSPPPTSEPRPSSSELRSSISDQSWNALVWSIPHIWLMKDTDGDGKVDQREVLYGPFDTTRDTHGNQASFRRGFDGWLYATHGFNNDSHVRGRDGHEIHLNSGNTYRLRLDGSRIEHHTYGQVNPFGLAWDPRGNLYSSDCHSAPIYQLLEGGYYPSFGKPHDGLGFAPTLMEHSHGSTAIDGMIYYADNLWPEEFRDNVFIGNVMTSRLNRDGLEFHGSTPRAIELPDFVTCDDPWFRPVDNQLGPDGALYIADFYNRIIGHYEVPLDHPGRDRERGRIWRVVYRGPDGKSGLRNPALPDRLEDLIVELGSSNLPRRMLAMNEICDRSDGNSAGVDVLMRTFRRHLETALATPGTNPQPTDHFLTHALWVCDRLGHLDDPTLNQVAGVGTLTSIHALRLITERGHQRAIAPQREGDRLLPLSLTNLVAVSLNHPDGLVRRCAVEVLGAWPAFHQLRSLLDLRRQVTPSDTHLLYVIRKAIRDHLQMDPIFQEVLAQTWSESDLAALSDVSVAVNTPLAGKFLLARLREAKVDRETASAWLRHAARYAPVEEMDNLAEVARKRIPEAGSAELHAELDRQFGLFQAVDQGLRQRGADLPNAVRSWGGDLAEAVLGKRPSSTWSNSPLPEQATENPWEFEERRRSDGRPFRSLSSFPRGEQLTGSLRSPAFVLPDRLGFWLCGHDGFPGQPPQRRNVVRLRLIPEEAPRAGDHPMPATEPVIVETFAPGDDVARRISWDLGVHRGRKAFLEVTDADAGNAFAWIAFGDFDPPTPAFPPLAPADLARQLVQAADLARRLDLGPLLTQLQELTSDPAADVEARGAAFAAVSQLSQDRAMIALASVMTDSEVPPAWRRRLIEAARSASTSAGESPFAAAVRESPYRVQLKAVRAGAALNPLAREFLDAIAAGRLPARLLQDRAINQRLAQSLPEESARIARLTSALPPPSDALDKLISQRRTGFDVTKASASTGRAVFEKNCAACHQVGGQGALIGPQLDGIGQRGLERVIEDVLDPNRNVDRAFRSHTFFMKDGDIQSGLPRREEGELVVVADSTGKEFSLAKNDIQERRESELSPMPENFGEIITADDLNDLLAFLLTQMASPPSR